eukprot:1394005-Amorphochlora_amoeboformis.AAC.1
MGCLRVEGINIYLFPPRELRARVLSLLSDPVHSFRSSYRLFGIRRGCSFRTFEGLRLGRPSKSRGVGAEVAWVCRCRRSLVKKLGKLRE